MHTQNIHATLELERLFDNVLRLVGNVNQKASHASGGVDFFLNYLHLLGDCLDLKRKKKISACFRPLYPIDNSIVKYKEITDYNYYKKAKPCLEVTLTPHSWIV